MKIQKEALEALQGASITGQKLAQLFEKMASELEQTGGASGLFTIDYQRPGEVDSDTLAPQVILVLRPLE